MGKATDFIKHYDKKIGSKENKDDNTDVDQQKDDGEGDDEKK